MEGWNKLFRIQEYEDIKSSIINFRNIFFSVPYPARTAKHIADPSAGASAKRINMFLRWMVRKDKNGVDFGIWDSIRPSQLVLPAGYSLQVMLQGSWDW